MTDIVFQMAKELGEYDSRLADIQKLYDADTDVQKEPAADRIGDYLFRDEAFVRSLSAKNPNLFLRVRDEIKHLYKLATAGSKEARALEKLKHTFEKVYRETKAQTPDGTKYSAEFAEAVKHTGILSLLQKIQSDPTGYNQKEHVSFGTVDKTVAERIKQAIGIDPTGYEVIIEARQIKHILNDHGTNGITDNSMSNTSDISKILYVLENPEEISDGGVTHAYFNFVNGKNRPARTVLYERSISEDGKSMYAVQAVPVSSKKKLYVVTAFIGESGYKNRASQFADTNSPGATAKTAAVNALNDNVPQNGNGVKGKNSLSAAVDFRDAQLVNIMASNVVNEARASGIDLSAYYRATGHINAFQPSNADIAEIADAIEPIVAQLGNSAYSGYVQKMRDVASKYDRKYSLSNSNTDAKGTAKGILDAPVNVAALPTKRTTRVTKKVTGADVPPPAAGKKRVLAQDVPPPIGEQQMEPEGKKNTEKSLKTKDFLVFIFGTSGDTAFFEKPSNINGFWVSEQ